MLILENVCKTYSTGFPALNNISLRVEKGEFVFIVGQSGAGKSTLIKLLLKELEPTSGHIFINGKNLGRAKRRELPLIRRDMGVVFQDFRLLEDRNIYDNIAFAQKVIEAPNRRIRSEVLSMLSMVGLLEKYRNFPSQLSGGEQQRAAIARALINKPAILLADEPTGNLDNANSWEIMKLLVEPAALFGDADGQQLEEANRRGTTVVVVTHNMDLVQTMKKRVITIDHGEIISDERWEDYGYED